MPRAARAAAALKRELGLEADLRQGPSGVFEVSVDGSVVARRKFLGLPSEEEIVEAVSSALGR